MLRGSVNKADQQSRSTWPSFNHETIDIDGATASTVKKDSTNRKLFVMHHGKRLGRTFPGWMQLGWTEGGRYKPYDLNMPMSLSSRANYFDSSNDGPLTEVGYITSQMCERAMRSLDDKR